MKKHDVYLRLPVREAHDISLKTALDRAWLEFEKTHGCKLSSMNASVRYSNGVLLQGEWRQGSVHDSMHVEIIVTDGLPSEKADPLPMLLWCPLCGARHVDEGEWAHKKHHTHACDSCGLHWRPALENTVGVLFLPGCGVTP